MCAQELCLYTLGNLCPVDVVKNKLVAQGIIPALANCIEVNQQGLTAFNPVKLDSVVSPIPLSEPCSENVSFNFLCVFRTIDITLL